MSLTSWVRDIDTTFADSTDTDAEHYFEMSHVDAEEALKIYRHFCSQTEKVVEFLGVAKKLQNLLNVPIPNLKHVGVSLLSVIFHSACF